LASPAFLLEVEAIASKASQSQKPDRASEG